MANERSLENTSIVADLLEPGSHNRAAINVATSHATIAIEDIDRYVLNLIVMERRLPLRLVGTVVHEWAHHHSLSGLVGTSMAFLAAELQARLDEGREGEPETAALLMRYEFALAMLLPVLEGLAVYAEHDLSIGKGPACPIFLGQLAARASDDRPQPNDLALAAADDLHRRSGWAALNDLLAAHRFSDEGLDRKSTVLRDPYSFRRGGGYLLGYLMVKRFLANIARELSENVESALYFEFLNAAIFEDPIIAHFLLINPKDNSREAVQDLLLNFGSALMCRLQWLEDSAAAKAIKEFENAIASEFHRTTVAAKLLGITGDDESNILGSCMGYLQNRLNSLSVPGDVAATRRQRILRQRVVFRFATGPTRVRLRDGQCFLLDRHEAMKAAGIDLDFFTMGPTLHDLLPNGDYDAELDLFFRSDSGLLVATPSLGEKIRLPNGFAVVTVNGVTVAIFVPMTEDHDVSTHRVWSEEIADRTGAGLAKRDALLGTQLTALRATSTWKALRPALREELSRAEKVYDNFSASVPEAHRAIFNEKTAEKGLAGIFDDREAQTRLKEIAKASSWASAVADGLGGLAPGYSAESFREVAVFLESYGGVLIERGDNNPICAW